MHAFFFRFGCQCAALCLAAALQRCNTEHCDAATLRCCAAPTTRWPVMSAFRRAAATPRATRSAVGRGQRFASTRMRAGDAAATLEHLLRRHGLGVSLGRPCVPAAVAPEDGPARALSPRCAVSSLAGVHRRRRRAQRGCSGPPLEHLSRRLDRGRTPARSPAQQRVVAPVTKQLASRVHSEERSAPLQRAAASRAAASNRSRRRGAPSEHQVAPLPAAAQQCDRLLQRTRARAGEQARRV